MLRKSLSDLQDLEPVQVSNDESLYYCPYCESEKGSPDIRGKLYVNWQKRVGWCHRCETSLRDDGYVDLVYVSSKLRAFLSNEKDPVRIFTVDSWTTPVHEDCEAQSYLESRDITPDMIEEFGLRASKFPIRGIVIPNLELKNGTTDYFQIRSLQKWYRPKYSNLPEVRKPLYRRHALKHGHSCVVINEGTLSAVSQSRIEGVGVLSIYGKYITDIQLESLKDIRPKICYIGLDGGFLKNISSTASRVQKVIGCEVRCILYPWQKDPNDLSEKELRQCWDSALPFNYHFHKYILHLVKSKRIDRKDQWEEARSKIS